MIAKILLACSLIISGNSNQNPLISPQNFGDTSLLHNKKASTLNIDACEDGTIQYDLCADFSSLEPEDCLNTVFSLDPNYGFIAIDNHTMSIKTTEKQLSCSFNEQGIETCISKVYKVQVNATSSNESAIILSQDYAIKVSPWFKCSLKGKMIALDFLGITGSVLVFLCFGYCYAKKRAKAKTNQDEGYGRLQVAI